MEAALQRRVQRYGWDKAATRYDDGWSRQLRPAQDAMLALAAIQPGERVIDIACGTGLVTFRAAMAAGPSGHVTGTDLSAGMLDLAASACAGQGLAPVEFRRMGAESLDLPDASFDVALNALGLMYVPDAGAALSEMRRVLVPGGRAALAVWGSRARCGWADIFPIVDARVKSDVCPLFFALGTGDRLADALADAGFASVDLHRMSVVLDYEDEDAALAAAFAGGPVAMAYSRFDDETRAEAHAEYLASIAPFRVGEGYRIPGEFVIASGVRG
ncbi:MAG: class I SAM-dependent methyltransferase [Vicinamibacterales bacterium]